MLIAAVLALTLVVKGACVVAENDAVSGLNKECNYAGKWVQVFTFTACVCCAPSQQDPSNECGDYWSCDTNDLSNECYQFSSSECTELEQFIYVNFVFG